MDIQERIELEQKRLRDLAEAKIQAKLDRQLRILKKERDVFVQVSNYEKSKQERSLKVLDTERQIELDRYMSVKAPNKEKKELYDVGIVRNLVRTKSIIQGLIDSERTVGRRLCKETQQIADAVVQQDKLTMKQAVENDKFRIPDPDKMDKRVQNANASYHTQRLKNRELQNEIDCSIITRKCFRREENKLKKELNGLNQKVSAIMRQASDIFQERELMEATKLKVQEHLSKVKEKYERELLGVTLALNDDKKSEEFMRTKVKDNANVLRERKAKENERVEAMLNSKDKFAQAFDEIKEAMGKTDINEIVQEFLEQEEKNFATFLGIGSVMEKNEKLRCDIMDLTEDNFEMEDSALESNKSQKDEIRAIKEQTTGLKKKTQDLNTRMEDISKVLQEFLQHLQTSTTIMKIDQDTLDNMLGRGAVMTEKNALKYLEVIMLELNGHLDDLTMIEVATRASLKGDPTTDETMLTRKPSLKITPAVPGRTMPLSLKANADSDSTKKTDLMVHSDLRDIAMKEIMTEPNKGLGHQGGRRKSRLHKSMMSSKEKK